MHPKGPTVREAIREALGEWFADNPKAIMLGEDLNDPYGGAFKVTKGLQELHPDRVISTPISEAAITGVAAGLSLKGWRPIVEIMFGDFVLLAFDQLANGLSKFRQMYAGQVRTPVVIRAAMGGRRGYGPTHSQSLEKHLLGLPDVQILAVNPFVDLSKTYRESLDRCDRPTIVIEDKVMYDLRTQEFKGSLSINTDSIAGAWPQSTVMNYGSSDLPDVTVLAYGAAAVECARTMVSLADEEIWVRMIVPWRIDPIDHAAILALVAPDRPLLVVEDGIADYGWGQALVGGLVAYASDSLPVTDVRVMGAARSVIPSIPDLERMTLPSPESVGEAILEML